jgi:hypothetical protein
VSLSSATVRRVKILEHFQPFRVDSTRLIASLAELADVAHLNLASPSGPAQIPRLARLPEPLAVVNLLSRKVCPIIVVGLSETATAYRQRCAAETQRSVRSVRTTLAHAVGGVPPMARDCQGWVRSRIAGLTWAS